MKTCVVHQRETSARCLTYSKITPAKVVIVTNRLPVTLKVVNDTDLEIIPSSGGLVSAMKNLPQDGIWIGWPGTYIPKNLEQKARDKCKEFGVVPVFLTQEEQDHYYNGYCNRVVWPALHYWPTTEVETMMDAYWRSYVSANAKFSKEIYDQYQKLSASGPKKEPAHTQNNDTQNDNTESVDPPPQKNRVSEKPSNQTAHQSSGADDHTASPEEAVGMEVVVWLHDLHLMLAPAFIRNHLPSVKIGWFLHTPFCRAARFAEIPQAAILLSALLTCDLLSFQHVSHLQHFKQACSVCLPPNEVCIKANSIDGRALAPTPWLLSDVPQPETPHRPITRLLANPIGIDPTPYMDTPAEEKSRLKTAAWLEALVQSRTVVLSVDRLDYMKGLYQKLRAYEHFCQTYPETAQDIVFIQLAVPSRTDVAEYRRLKMKCDEVVCRINANHSPTLEDMHEIRSKRPAGANSVDWETVTTEEVAERTTPRKILPDPRNPKAVEFWFTSVDPQELKDLYCLASVCFIGSMRDGMNLVALEYLALNKTRPKILATSEFVGCTTNLVAACVTFNPWSMADTAKVLKDIVSLPMSQRCAFSSNAERYVTLYTAQAWAERFVKHLCVPNATNASINAIDLKGRPNLQVIVNADLFPEGKLPEFREGWLCIYVTENDQKSPPTAILEGGGAMKFFLTPSSHYHWSPADRKWRLLAPEDFYEPISDQLISWHTRLRSEFADLAEADIQSCVLKNHCIDIVVHGAHELRRIAKLCSVLECRVENISPTTLRLTVPQDSSVDRRTASLLKDDMDTVFIGVTSHRNSSSSGGRSNIWQLNLKEEDPNDSEHCYVGDTVDELVGVLGGIMTTS